MATTSNLIIKYPLDLTGTNPDNLVSNEPHTAPRETARGFGVNYGAFYTKSVRITHTATGRTLVKGTDYICLELIEDAFRASGQEVCAAIQIINEQLDGEFLVTYQAIGGEFSTSVDVITELLIALALDNRPVKWGDILGLPEAYPPSSHLHSVDDLYGFEYMVEALERIRSAILLGDYYDYEEIRQRIANLKAFLLAEDAKLTSQLQTHLDDRLNPHATTKAQVGLGNVENFPMASDAEAIDGLLRNRYMSPAATKVLIAQLSSETVAGHASNYNNSHHVTAVQVGLGNVDNYVTATQLEAETGTRNDLFVTPLRVAQAIKKLVGDTLAAHIANTSNPHAVTKEQVGLGNLVNHVYATSEEALAGTNSRHVTATLVKYAIDNLAVLPLNTHIGNTNNPHATTKEQVGLGNVDNYLTATQAQAEAGTATDAFMTPLRVAQAIAKQALIPLNTHIGNYNNPHQVSKAQVGLGSVANYSVASQAEAEAGARNDLYLTPLLVKQAITAQVGISLNAHVGNTNNPHSTNKAQVGLGNVDNYSVASQAEAEAGNTDSRYMTPLKVKQAIAALLGGTVNAHINNFSNPHGVNKWTVGLGNVANYPVASQAQVDSGAGGCYVTADTLHARLGSISVGSTVGVLSGVISNGQTIPLPAGFAEWQCKWLVSTRNSNVNGNGWDVREGLPTIHYQELCYCDGRVVTCVTKVYEDRNDSIITIAADANYIIVGVK